jgi:hypothetical protein
MEPTMIAGAVSSGLQFLGGLGQALFSGVKKKERALERHANSYQKNESVMDYYNKALAKYNPNAYASQSYQNDTNQIQRNLQSGISASQDRRGGLSTITGLVQGANDSSAKAASRAEGAQAQNLSQLGGATQMKAAEDTKKFDMQYNLLAMKAGAAAKQKSQGLQNMFGGLSNASSVFGGGGKKQQTGGVSTEDYLDAWGV